MRFFSTIALLLFTTIGAVGQNGHSISGSVSDANGAVSGAVVTLTVDGETTPKYTTETKANGLFGFYAAPGKYILKAVRIDGRRSFYASVAVEIQVDDQKYIDLSLVESPAIRESVTISAETSQTVEQVSKTVNVIDGQEMRDRADFTLVDILRTIPGFRVQQLGGFGRTASIKSRGLRNQDTAVLIDGIRFRDPGSITGDATPFLSDITLTSVNRIEVLRGSGSSLYGTNAIGGTLDFQTPRASHGVHGQVSGAAGGLGLGRFRGNLSYGTDDNKFGITGAVSRTAYTKGIDGEDNANNTNFQTRVDANPFSKTSVSGRIFVSDADVGLNSNPDTRGTLPASNATIINAIPNVSFVPDLNDPDSVQRSRFISGQFVVNHVINSKLVVSGYYQGLKTKRTNDNGPLGVGFQSASTSIFDGTIHTGNAHLKWTPNGANQITAGYEFEREKFGNDGRTPSGTANFFTRAGQQSNTFYVQDLVSLLDGNLQFAGGFRAQRFSLSAPTFSLANAPYSNLTLTNPPTAYTFDSSASYFFKKSGTKLRVHAGNGYRVPSLFERFGSFFSSFGTPSFVALGDPFLKPEKTIAFDAGIEQNLVKDRVRLSATYFYTQLKDIIGFGNVVPNIGTTTRPFGGYLNQKGGIARGGEFSGTVRPTNSTDIFTSYTYTNSDQRTPQVSGSRIIKTLGIPDHQFTLVVTQRFKRFWVNFDFLATARYLAPIFSNTTFTAYVYRFKGNRKGDLTAGYTFGFEKEKMTLRIYGTIENVFDNEYFENGFRTPHRNGRVGLSFGF
jgi:vitamin B12 transporter